MCPVVIATHADMLLEYPEESYRKPFEPIIATFEQEVAAFAGPVLLIHGDSHEFMVDHPLRSSTTGARIPGFTRLQVSGSYDVGWVRVVVPPGPDPEFTFEQHLIPRWLVW